MKTLLLTLDNWDFCLDAAGNWAVASEPYSYAQDVASACRTFLGEVWFDDTIGVPYFQKILGQTPPLSLFRRYMVDAALTVPGVVSATCTIQSFIGRNVVGQVDFVDVNGGTGSVPIAPLVASSTAGVLGSSPPWTADSTTVLADSTFYKADG